MMYEVRFIRTDTAADESYYYQDTNDANYHFNLFDAADSDLYFAVQIYHTNMLIAQKVLGFSDEELRILLEVATKDQFDTCLALLHAAENENGSLQELLVQLRLKVVGIAYDRYEDFFKLICA